MALRDPQVCRRSGRWSVVSRRCSAPGAVFAATSTTNTTEDHRRYLSFAVAVFMVIVAVWQLRDVRREVRNP
jgi:hypothetical protein